MPTQKLSDIFEDARKDPKYQEILAQAKDRYRRARKVTCEFGNCMIILDPDTGEDMGGIGPVGCAHEYLPGGNATSRKDTHD